MNWVMLFQYLEHKVIGRAIAGVVQPAAFILKHVAEAAIEPVVIFLNYGVCGGYCNHPGSSAKKDPLITSDNNSSGINTCNP